LGAAFRAFLRKTATSSIEEGRRFEAGGPLGESGANRAKHNRDSPEGLSRRALSHALAVWSMRSAREAKLERLRGRRVHEALAFRADAPSPHSPSVSCIEHRPFRAVFAREKRVSCFSRLSQWLPSFEAPRKVTSGPAREGCPQVEQ